MYVCLCNRVTDRELIREAADSGYAPAAQGGRSFGEQVADRLGAGVECGACRELAVDLVERAAASRALGRAA